VLFGARRITADEAKHFGLVNIVAKPTSVMDVARELAQRVLRSAPLSVAAVLDIARQSESLSIAEAMVALRENDSYRAAIDSRDAREGPRAFAEKRDPKWEGR
jgi:crotonobetainyl-CoA hydratase